MVISHSSLPFLVRSSRLCGSRSVPRHLFASAISTGVNRHEHRLFAEHGLDRLSGWMALMSTSVELSARTSRGHLADQRHQNAGCANACCAGRRHIDKVAPTHPLRRIIGTVSNSSFVMIDPCLYQWSMRAAGRKNE
jgi:hypothetical protein